MATLNFLKAQNLKGDLFGGLTAGIVALPLALAFGIQAFSGVTDPSASSLGALAGLVGATFLGFFASLFGGTHSQISGPTGPMTVITASLIGGVWASSGGSLSTVLVTMSLSGLFCGLFQILFGVLKIGKYVRYIPYPVLSGFMSGIGVIIILQQIYPIVGLKAPVKVLDMLINYPSALAGGISFTALLLGIGTILIIWLLPKLTKTVPATLVALIAMTVLSLFLNLNDSLIIGTIPSGLPMPFFAKSNIDLAGIDWASALKAAIAPGLTLACLGSIDTLLTSVVADNITKTKHNSNKELIGQGIGNAVAGLFCGISGAGATMRTVVNVKSGGRTQLSGMVHALLLLSILLGLGSLVKFVPLSVLAGILITVGAGIIDIRGFKDLLKVDRSDAFVLVAVFLVTVFLDLLTAVAIGMVAACVLFMKNFGDLIEKSEELDHIKAQDEESPWDDDALIPESIKERVCIIHLSGPLFFGSVTKFNDMIASVPKESDIVIIRMKKVAYIDQSGLYAIESAVHDLHEKNKELYFSMVMGQPMQSFKSINLVPDVVPEDHVFDTFKDCADFLSRNI
ncbi:MAG: SulP family inorganic anion transporter [Bacteroidales bacterium]|nr:SulP family inorganic anion transporter [Bacteroidales bacterium]MCI5619899.1 SulP family inorganic anion transporter [Rikenellaceae bacterium]